MVKFFALLMALLMLTTCFVVTSSATSVDDSIITLTNLATSSFQETDNGQYYAIIVDGVELQKLKITWLDSFDRYQIYIKALSGEPDPDNACEDGTLLVDKNTRSNKYSISKSKMKKVGLNGWIKFSIQGSTTQRGNTTHSPVCNFYIWTGSGQAPQFDTDKRLNATPFLQTRGDWADYAYGHKDTLHARKTDLATSGCGILTYVNAIYSLTGHFVDPTFIADYSLDGGHRICGVGTSSSLYKAFAEDYGETYDFEYGGFYSANYSIGSSKYAKRLETMKNILLDGGVLVVGVKGHLLCVASYDEETDRYYVLDSYPTSSRGTSENGDWLLAEDFSGKMKVRYFMSILPIE